MNNDVKGRRNKQIVDKLLDLVMSLRYRKDKEFGKGMLSSVCTRNRMKN